MHRWTNAKEQNKKAEKDTPQEGEVDHSTGAVVGARQGEGTDPGPKSACGNRGVLFIQGTGGRRRNPGTKEDGEGAWEPTRGKEKGRRPAARGGERQKKQDNRSEAKGSRLESVRKRGKRNA